MLNILEGCVIIAVLCGGKCRTRTYDTPVMESDIRFELTPIGWKPIMLPLNTNPTQPDALPTELTNQNADMKDHASITKKRERQRKMRIWGIFFIFPPLY